MPANAYGINLGEIMQQGNQLALQKYQLGALQREEQTRSALSKYAPQLMDAGTRGGALQGIASAAPDALPTAVDLIGKYDALDDAKRKRMHEITDLVAQTAGAVSSAPDEILPQKLSEAAQSLKSQGIQTPQWDQALASGDLGKIRQALSQTVEQGRTIQERAAQVNADRTFTAQQENTKAARESTDAYRKATLTQGQERIGIARDAAGAKAAASAAGALDDPTISQMADQYIAGDKSVMQNLGRGTQGASNIVKLRGKVAQKLAEQGKTGADMAQAMAEFQGLTSGERALGTRTANIGMAVNEAQQLIPLALKASDDIARTGFVPLTRAIQAVEKGTNNEALRRFVAANNSLVNVYARAINPTGVPTESDKAHAREMLDTAFDQKSYAGVVDQLRLEMEAAQKSPAAVREEFRYGTETSRTNAAPSVPGSRIRYDAQGNRVQ